MSPSAWWDRGVILRSVKSLTANPAHRIWLDVGTEEGGMADNAKRCAMPLTRRVGRSTQTCITSKTKGLARDGALQRTHKSLRFLFPVTKGEDDGAPAIIRSFSSKITVSCSQHRLPNGSALYLAQIQMKRSTRGCGCAIAVLVLLTAAAGGAVWKFDLIKWWRTQPPKPTGELKIVVLDVGPVEGDSTLILAPGGKSVLIDAGDAGKGKVVLEALKRHKVEKLDYFIATHPHPDHIGAADEVLNGSKVATVIDTELTFDASASPTRRDAVRELLRPGAEKTRPTVTSFFEEYKEALQKSGAQQQKLSPAED